MRRRGLRRLAIARLLGGDEDDEGIFDDLDILGDEDEDEDDEEGMGRGGKLLLARRAGRRRALRRLALIKLLAGAGDEEEDGDDEEGMGRGGKLILARRARRRRAIRRMAIARNIGGDEDEDGDEEGLLAELIGAHG